MINSRQLFREMLIYGFSGVAGRLFGLLLLPLFTHYLSAAEYGALDFSLSLVVLLGLLFGWQTESALVRGYAEARERGTAIALVGTAWIAWTVSSLVGCVLLAVAAPYLAPYVYGELASHGVGWLVLLALAVFWHVQFHQLKHVLRVQHRAAMFGIVSLAPMLVFACGAFLAIKKQWGVSGILTAFAGAHAAGFLLLVTVLWRDVRFVFDRSYFREIYQYSLPLLPAVLLNWAQRQGMRFVIIGALGLEMMGKFGVADKFAMVMTMVNMMVRQAWTPHAVRIMKREGAEQVYARYFNWYAGANVCIVALLVLLCPWILGWIAPASYGAAEQAVSWFVSGVALMGTNTFASLGNIVARRTARNLPGVFVASVIAVGGSVWAVGQALPLQSIGMVFFAAALVSFLINYAMAQRVHFIPYSRWSLVGYVCALCLLASVPVWTT